MANTGRSNEHQQLQWILGEDAGLREQLTREQWAAPHVFIGIGGTGTQTVTMIADRLAAMVAETPGAATALPSCLQFVAIDTDSTELSPQVRRAGVEVVDLTVANPEVVWQENEEAFQSLGFQKPIRVELGAGGRRKVGRFAFVSHSDRIKQALESALAEAQQYPGLEHNRDPRIHLFFSLAGGTGCGSFLDLAFLVRDMTENMARTEVNAYVVIPDNIVATVSGPTMASSAAALKELEYFMQLSRGTPAFDGWANAPRSGDQINYWKGGRVRGLVRRPFDVCYLFGSAGQGTGTVGQPGDFPGVLSEASIRNAFAEAGEWNRKRVMGGDIAGYFDEDWNGKYHSFSAIGFSRLILPTDELGAYLLLELAEGVSDFLLDGPQPWNRQSPEATGLLQTYVQKLTTKLSVDQIVPARKRAMVDMAAAVGELEIRFKKKEDNFVKQACDTLPNLFDALWSESEKTREEAIESRRRVVRDLFDVHTDDLNVGLRDDVAFFTDLKARMFEYQADCLKLAKQARHRLDAYLAKIPAAAKFLGQKGITQFFTRESNCNHLKGVYQLAVTGVREFLLARANEDLAGALVQELDIQLSNMTRACERISNDLKARYVKRRAYFRTRLEKMRHGKAGVDCKTFCPVEMERITEQAEQMLAPLRSKFGGILNHAIKQGRLDLKSLSAGGAKEMESVRLEILKMFLPEVAVEQLWQTLVTDAEEWDRTLQEYRRRILVASSPLLMFNAPPRSGVVGCYANISNDELARFNAAPPDLGKYRKHGMKPLVPQSDCAEATRFFHGIRLRDLAIVSEMGRQYRAYMEDLRRVSAAARDVDDHVNLFESLVGWTPPDEPAPKAAEDELLRLWTLGLCFSEVFPADKKHQAALEAANKLAKPSGQPAVKGRKNFIFNNGHVYYLQPFYEGSAPHAPALISLGRGRETAHVAFRGNGEAVAEMRKWYNHVEATWTEHFTQPDLQKAIANYLKKLTGASRLFVEEREVVSKFMSEPFPE